MTGEEWKDMQAKLFALAFFERKQDRRQQLHRLAQGGDKLAADILAKLEDDSEKLRRTSIGRMLHKTIQRNLEHWLGTVTGEVITNDSATIVCPECARLNVANPTRIKPSQLRTLMRARPLRNRRNTEEPLRGTESAGGAGPNFGDTSKVEQKDGIWSAAAEAEAFDVQRCANGHEVTAKAILQAGSVVQEGAPCPRCTEQPPGIFSRLRCLTYFEEGDTEHTGVATCPKCNQATSILEIFPPEVFLSYSWGVHVLPPPGAEYRKVHPAQELLKTVRRAVELESSALCWLDVGGGLNPGQDHVFLMRQGMERAYVAILFLSDRYLKSDNCKRELYLALECGRHIIPVLLPPVELAGSTDPEAWRHWDYKSPAALEEALRDSAWRGPFPAGADWWRHAEDLCAKGEANPTTPDGGTIVWEELKRFAPLDLRTSAPAATPAAATRAGKGDRSISEAISESVAALKDRLMTELRLGARVMEQLHPMDCYQEVRRAHRGWRNLQFLHRLSTVGRQRSVSQPSVPAAKEVRPAGRKSDVDAAAVADLGSALVI